MDKVTFDLETVKRMIEEEKAKTRKLTLEEVVYYSPKQPELLTKLTDAQYFEIGQRHWLPSNKIEQIHKEILEAVHGIKE
jgi:hypothetical protein